MLYCNYSTLDHLDEGRKVDILLLCNALGLQYHEMVDGSMEEVDFEILALPDERAAGLADNRAIRVGLLEQALIQRIGHLALCFQHFAGRHPLLGLMDIDHLATPVATTQANLTVGLAHQVGLGNLALYTLRQLASQFDDVHALLRNRLRQSENVGNLLDDPAQLGIEDIVVVDDAQVGVSRPRPVDLLVQVASQLQSFLVSLLIAIRIVCHRVILLGTIGSTDQVEHGIIALAQLVGIGATLAGDVVPHLWGYISRDVHRTTIAYDKSRLRTGFCQSHKRVLQRQLRLKDGQFALVVELAIGG